MANSRGDPLPAQLHLVNNSGDTTHRCWISVSVSDSQTLEVQSGEEVTLLCSNYSSSPTQIFWFRVTKRSELHCICSMSQPHEPASFCTGIQSGKFEMSTNISTVFLKIKQVDLLDSGLYFCGTYLSNYAVIVHATNVEVQDVFDRLPKMMSVVLGALTVFLIMAVIYLAAKIKHLQKVMIVDLLVKIFILQTDQVNQTSDRTIANVFFRQKVNEPLP
nr:PREDICTED: uncharacterized protein LOC102215093 [Pundamilia nyererei]